MAWESANLSAFVAVALFAGVLFSSMALWGVAAQRIGAGVPLLPRDPHRLAVWGFIDILVTVAALIAIQMLAGVLLSRAGLLTNGAERTLDDYYITLMTSAVCSLGAFIVSWLWLKIRSGASAADLGFRTDRIGRDLLIGVAAFVMLAPLVFGVQLIFVLIMGPTKHPLILLLQKSPEIRLFVAASLNAVIVAPIVEEYFFRGLWQGWTESIRMPLSGDELLFGRRSYGALQPDTATIAAKPADSAVVDPNPYAAPTAITSASEEAVAPPSISDRTLWWPILLSAGLFALAHFSHGPDGIALFVLATGLGYVYQRTRSLLPSIVVHFLLNATSMVMLWVQLYL